jgi:drug/metabolite transporter (DMT)-like permease
MVTAAYPQWSCANAWLLHAVSAKGAGHFVWPSVSQNPQGTGMRKEEQMGLLYGLAGFAMLSVGDAVVKSMAGQWPAPAIAALRYTLGVSGLGVALALAEGRAGFAFPQARFQVLSGTAVAMATVAFFSALALMPLATATAILFTAPMLTALLAALLLGEPLRRETWIASIVAFAGVFIACSATTAHTLIYLATTRAGAAMVAPMTYVQLLVATAIGWGVFREPPDALTLAGAAVIVGSGIYFWRSSLSRTARTSAQPA